MNTSSLLASAITVLFVLGLVLYRLLWAASSVTAAAGLNPRSKIPKSWRRWLFGERNDSPVRQKPPQI